MTTSTTSLSKKALIKIGAILVWLLIWQIISVLIGSRFLFPSPVSVFSRFLSLCATSDFWKSCLLSLLRISAGCILGIIIGTFLGAVTAVSDAIYSLFSPILTLIKTTPVASFIILLLVWVKRDGITVIISCLLVIPVLWANTSSAVKNTDKNLLEMARIFSFSKWKTIKTIYVPEAVPSFVAGCTTAIGFSWKSGIAAEVIANPSTAIGTHLYYAKINLEYTDLFAWTISVIVISLIVEKLLVYLLNRFVFSGVKYGN